MKRSNVSRVGFPYPRAKHDFVAENRRRFVVDLVPQHDPANRFLRFGGRERFPVRRRHILHPAQVNGVVHVILPVDISGQNRDGDFEDLGHVGEKRKAEN